jgi:hypothetical protein
MENLKYTGPELIEDEGFAALPEALQELLRETNGYLAYEGGFHLRGYCSKPQWHSLQAVTSGDWAMHELFEEVQEGDIAFAQDCMGDQFILRGTSVLRLYAEPGEIDDLNIDFKSFIEKIKSEPESLLDLEVMDLVNESEDSLEVGDLMIAQPPFCMEEADEGVKLEALPCLEALEYYAELAGNIKSLAKGTMEDES